jgi:hypothetical protein
MSENTRIEEEMEREGKMEGGKESWREKAPATCRYDRFESAAEKQ